MTIPIIPRWYKRWLKFWLNFFKLFAIASLFVLMCVVVGVAVGGILFYMTSWIGFSSTLAALIGMVFGLTAMILTGVWILS